MSGMRWWILLFSFLALLLVVGTSLVVGGPAETAVMVVSDRNDPPVAHLEIDLRARLKALRSQGVFNIAGLSQDFISYDYSVPHHQEFCQGVLGIRRDDLLLLGLVELDSSGLPVKLVWSTRVESIDSAIVALKDKLGISSLSSTGVAVPSSTPAIGAIASPQPSPSSVAQGASSSNFSEDLGNGVNLEMVYIPGGTFLMGSPDNEEGRFDNEGPQHKVKLGPFWIGKYEVTQGQWKAVMGSNLSYPPLKGADRPIYLANWMDAKEFCRRLSLSTGKTYCLPSEAQWEYACRAGSTTRYSSTDSDKSLGDYAWYRNNTAPADRVTQVGRKLPNPWGLYDMHGGMYEWCEDVWHDRYYGAPLDGSAWTDKPTIVTIGEYTGEARVLRGGCWFHVARYCRSAFRTRNLAAARISHGDGPFIFGFRVVVPGPASQ